MRSISVDNAWGGRSIQTRVLLLVGLGVLAALTIFGGTSWVGLDRAAEALAAERQLLARSVANHLDYLVQGDLEILQALSAAPRGSAPDSNVLPEPAALRSAYLRAHVVERVFLVAKNGTLLQNEPDMRPGATLPVPAESDIAAAFQSGRPVVTDVTGQAPRRLYLLVPMRNWLGQIVALAGGEIDPEASRFSSLLEAFRFVTAGSVDLVDSHGLTIASTSPSRRFIPVENPDEVAASLQARRSWVGHGTRDAATTVIAMWPMTSGHWGVVVRQEQTEAFASTLLVRRTMIWLGPVLLALTLLFAWGGARSVLNPIAALTHSAEGIAYGNLNQPIPPMGDDEIGRLGRSFEHMRLALKASLAHIEQANEVLEQRVEERTQELKGLYLKLQEREAWREELLRKVISAQEDERKRLARELHDETSQTLSALAMKIETALTAWPSEPGRERLVEARALTVRTLEELHRLIFDLRPSVLDDLGLLSAIRWYAERPLEPRGVAVRCEFSGFWRRLMPELETALFRVVQEAITNIAKHSGAETVLIQCLERDDRIAIEIEDDGQGFSPESLPPPAARERGLGLLGMRERIQLFGGTIEIDSAPGSGTRIVVSVPLTESEMTPAGTPPAASPSRVTERADEQHPGAHRG